MRAPTSPSELAKIVANSAASTEVLSTDAMLLFVDDRGRPHRLDGPARVTHHASGSVYEWFLYGMRHRTDGPAVVKMLGDMVFEEQWWRAGARHRTGLPARTIFEDDEKTPRAQWWFENGKPHRLDGPCESRSVDGARDEFLWSPRWSLRGNFMSEARHRLIAACGVNERNESALSVLEKVWAPQMDKDSDEVVVALMTHPNPLLGETP